MAGRLRRLLWTVRRGRADLGDLPDLAARPVQPLGEATLSPAQAMARSLLTRCLAGSQPERCRVLGPGRLVAEATLPLACRVDPLPNDEASADRDRKLDWVVIGDGLASLADPAAALARAARWLQYHPTQKVLLVLPGTALLPDDLPPHPRRWLFGPVGGKALAETAFGNHLEPLACLGNVLAASAELLGLGSDRLWPDEIEAQDPEYPMVVALATRA